MSGFCKQNELLVLTEKVNVQDAGILNSIKNVKIIQIQTELKFDELEISQCIVWISFHE